MLTIYFYTILHYNNVVIKSIDSDKWNKIIFSGENDFLYSFICVNPQFFVSLFWVAKKVQ